MYSHGEVKEGSLLCDSCGTRYPILNYVPRFVPADAYVGSFTFQWKHTPGEVVSWFKEAGFNEIFVSSHPVSVVGSKTQQDITSQASAAERI